MLPAFAAPILALLVWPSPDGIGESARDILLRSLDAKNRISVTMIQIQPGGPARDDKSGSKSVSMPDRDFVQTKLQLSRDGKCRRTVLQPLRMQGIISIDDGQNWTTILPDEKKVIIQSSPSAHRFDTRQKMALIDRNYVLKLEKQLDIAGRRSNSVLAIPKQKELSSRRFVIDADTYVLLRQESIDPNGKVTLQFDTQAIEFPRRQDPALFRKPDLQSLKIVNLPAPKRVDDLSQVRQLIGFDPRNPDDLPYGFEIVEWHLLGADDSPFICARLSDGIASVSVYQWDMRRKYKDMPFRSGGDAVDDGINIKVFGDLPRSIRTKIAEKFKAAGTRP